MKEQNPGGFKKGVGNHNNVPVEGQIPMNPIHQNDLPSTSKDFDETFDLDLGGFDVVQFMRDIEQDMSGAMDIDESLFLEPGIAPDMLETLPNNNPSTSHKNSMEIEDVVQTLPQIGSGELGRKVEELQAKVKKRQSNIERTCESLLKRLQKLQINIVGCHVAEENAAVFQMETQERTQSVKVMPQKRKMTSIEPEEAKTTPLEVEVKYNGIEAVVGPLESHLRHLQTNADSDRTASSSENESCDESDENQENTSRKHTKKIRPKKL